MRNMKTAYVYSNNSKIKKKYSLLKYEKGDIINKLKRVTKNNTFTHLFFHPLLF